MSELTCFPFALGHGQEGVCLYLQMGDRRILLDCGLSSLAALEVVRPMVESADLLFCSHAHRDHAQGLWAFSQHFPQVPIYASEVTTQLLPLNWINQGQPLPPQLGHALPWHTPLELTDDLTIQIWPAGHLPGAASALFTYRTPQRAYRVFYAGDFFMSNSRLVEGLPLEALRGLKPDVLILEGSAGTARHPHRRQQENQLAATLYHLWRQGRSLLLPVPTLGLGQELLVLLRSHHQFTGQDITVWVDSRVAAGCDAYLDLLPHLPSSIQNFARHQPLFWDDRIRPRMRRLPNPAQPVTDQPCIVIGDQATDLIGYCRSSPQPWSILLPADLASDLAQGMLREGKAGPTSNFDWLQGLGPELANGQVQLHTYTLTSHSDRVGTAQLIHNLRPQHVVLIHGQPNHLADLAALEELQTRYQLHLPTAGTPLDFALGDRFLQPAAPDLMVEAEIIDAEEGVRLQLPDTLTADPRWRRLTDSGLVQVRWQGDELVLKGLSQRDLQRWLGLEDATPLQNCFHCRHRQAGRCSHIHSPLYGMVVSPTASCQVFRSAAEPQDSSDR
ncbi:MAG: MBL fold metallo-hydrolase [Cyanobacteriota bacterium]|nr:MBL fold metallo-hydrolase [Cyanobacteriota bacterium]